MASGWVKSLQCKSRALDDVYHDPNPKTRLINSVSCRKSFQNIKDVVVFLDTTPTKPPSRSKSATRRRHDPHPVPPTTRTTTRSRHDVVVEPFLTELPEGHPSRNVVEIIFHTSWSPKTFPGRIEMIFKVKNGSNTVARFEEYREVVRSRYSGATKVGSNDDLLEDARCVADGNEVMRFHCLASSSGVHQYAFAGASMSFHNGAKGTAICTFSGSRTAHDNAGASRGRRAMLVCRVVAGRVSKQRLDLQSLLHGRLNGFDSVSGDNGDLLVFDPRAVLPCFLIIYKL